ncbi:MAG: M20/M25/M40 family metallo-hydrolase [Gemmatimonadales bacterium]|nr:M20/M25/M40 family metallo-hydrolase [Gemmatimonadales bacterium]
MSAFSMTVTAGDSTTSARYPRHSQRTLPPTERFRIGRRWLLATLLLVAVPGASLPAQSDLRSEIRQYRVRHEAAIVRELADFVALPNVASNLDDIRTNARHLVGMMERRGISARMLELDGTPPAVYGELLTPGATRTVVFYAHYDGQPVDSTRWASSPWRPVLRTGFPGPAAKELDLAGVNGRFDPEARLYARGVSDDKGPIVAVLHAIDALKASGTPLSVNLKFFFEGEEEAGSANLRPMLTKYRSLLAADYWIFGDGPVHQTRAPQAVFGVRGVTGLDLTVYGPIRPLHSGHYGNWAPNANAMLVHLLASMRDTEGRITIAGFMDDVVPLSAAERDALRSIPAVESQLIGEFRIGRTEGSPASLAEAIALPALNMSGLSGGRAAGGGANVIVPEAAAYLDFRLVPNQTPERIRALVERHIRAQGYHIVSETPDSATRRAHPRIVRLNWLSGYASARTAVDGPGSRALLTAVDEFLGAPIMRVPTLGGSLPLSVFVEVLGAQFAVLPIVNHDNNQHGENENLRLQNLWDGIELYAGVLARMGKVWQQVP